MAHDRSRQTPLLWPTDPDPPAPRTADSPFKRTLSGKETEGAMFKPSREDAPFKRSLSGQNQATSAGTITAFCDGGARGNPGPSGFGVYITDERGEKVAELSEFLGIRTNNFAEYSGLLAALEFALRYDHPRLRVVSDSELMVKQIKGQYKVKSPDLRPLYEEAKRRIAGLESFQIEHVLRNKNKEADRLANLAMDKGMRKAK